MVGLLFGWSDGQFVGWWLGLSVDGLVGGLLLARLVGCLVVWLIG